MFWLFGGIPGIGEKDDFSHRKRNVMPVCQYCRSKQELPMPLAFLGALLLLLFLLPQWRQAVGRRPKAGEQINMKHSPAQLIYFRKHDKRCPTHLTEPSHSGDWPFPFPLPFGLSLLLFTLGPRGELLIKGGAASRDRAEGTLTSVFIQVMRYETWNLSCKDSARWGTHCWGMSYSFWILISELLEFGLYAESAAGSVHPNYKKSYLVPFCFRSNAMEVNGI